MGAGARPERPRRRVICNPARVRKRGGHTRSSRVLPAAAKCPNADTRADLEQRRGQGAPVPVARGAAGRSGRWRRWDTWAGSGPPLGLCGGLVCFPVQDSGRPEVTSQKATLG